jgi:hypothetical protein
MELYFHSPSTPSWHGAQLKHWDNFTFNFTLPLPLPLPLPLIQHSGLMQHTASHAGIIF